MDLELVTRAAAFAGEAHKGQLRKEGNEPYINHPLRVAHTAVLAGLPAHCVAAALLHDVVEDTDVSQATIDAEFPPRVGVLVKLLTKWWPDDAPAAEKQAGMPTYYGAIEADHEAVVLKLLDRADNLESMVRMLPRGFDWAKRYATKTEREIVPLAKKCPNQRALTIFNEALARLKAKLATVEAKR